MTVRPEVLRHYHAAVWDGRDLDRFRSGASFDELVALLRIEYPEMTPAIAAQGAGAFGRPDLAGATSKKAWPSARPDFNHDDLLALGEEHPHLFVQKSGKLDLKKALARRKARILTCHTNAVTGWQALRQGGGWLHIHLYLCTTTDKRILEPTLPCERLLLHQCDDTTLEVASRSLESTDVEVTHADPVDLALFSAHARLAALFVDAPLVTGGCHLSTRVLRVLVAPGVASLADIAPALAASAATLEVVRIQPDAPFAPPDLPAMPRLRRLEVPAYPELRAEWIEFAVGNPGLGIRFHRIPPAAAPATARPRAKAARRAGAEFESWDGRVAPAIIAAARALVTRASNRLDKLGKAGPLDEQKAVLRRCVEGFNQLDARSGHFIQTIEAEDISDVIDRLCKKTRIRRKRLADEWRDW